MCGTCGALYAQYEALRDQLVVSRDNAEKCLRNAQATTEDFSNVIIGGSPIDGDIISNCSVSLSGVKSSLNSMIKQCESKMLDIANGCPGPDHYEDEEESS